MKKMKLVFLTLALLLAGCADFQTSTHSISSKYSIETATHDPAKNSYDGTASSTSASAAEVRSVVEAIDWVSGKTSTALLIAPVDVDADETYLSFQHEMNVESARVIAFWKVRDEDSARRLDGPDEKTIQRLVDAYTRGEDLTEVAAWSFPDGERGARNSMTEK